VILRPPLGNNGRAFLRITDCPRTVLAKRTGFKVYKSGQTVFSRLHGHKMLKCRCLVYNSITSKDVTKMSKLGYFDRGGLFNNAVCFNKVCRRLPSSNKIVIHK